MAFVDLGQSFPKERLIADIDVETAENRPSKVWDRETVQTGVLVREFDD